MTMEKFTITERYAAPAERSAGESEDRHGIRRDRDRPETRREFLLTLGTGAGVVAIGYQGAASLRSLVPNVSYDAPTTVKLGLPADFPDGLKFLPDQRLFVFREGKIFHAISAVCTHLGLHGARRGAVAIPRPARWTASRCA